MLPIPKDSAEYLSYNPETGALTWRVPTGKRVKAGYEAGSKTSYGYLQVRLNGVIYKAHRLAWFLHYGEQPEGEIDHVNGVGTDNRISNLRLASSRENSLNQRLRKDNTSGLKGVSYSRKAGKWVGQVCGKWVGYFDTPEEAGRAVKEYREKQQGDFANHG